MSTDFYIQSGQVITKFTNDTTGLFSLVKFFKKMANRFHVPLVDDCCDSTTDPTNLPVRYNSTLAHLEYYNYTNNTWTRLTTF